MWGQRKHGGGGGGVDGEQKRASGAAVTAKALKQVQELVQ